MIKYTCGAGTPEEAETNCTYFIRGECTACFCEYRRKKQTNADLIRAMNDEELCDLLDEWWCMGANNDERLAYADERLAWLQQLAGEEKEGADNA